VNSIDSVKDVFLAKPFPVSKELAGLEKFMKNKINHLEAIIFDLGNVVINFSFDNTFYYWAKVSGCD